MKITKTVFVLLVIILCSKISLTQNIIADTTLANKYKTLADNYNVNRKRDSSVTYYKKAVGIYWKYYKINKEENILKNFLHCQSNLSYDLAFIGQNIEAFKIAENTIELCNNYLTPNDELLARAYLGLAHCYDFNQEFETAIEYYGKSLETYEEINEEKNIYVFRIYSNIAFIYYYFGMYDSAIEYSEIALNLIIELFGEETTNSAALYDVSGVIYKALGEFELSLECELKALSIFTKIGGDETVDVANVYLNLGGLYQRSFLYDKSLECYDKVLKIYLKVFGPNDINVANVYNNIGVVYNDKGEHNLALEFYLVAKDSYLSILGENHSLVATSYNNIGVTYEITGEYKNALDYYNKALTIRKKLLGENQANVAILYGNIGVLHLKNKEYNLAIEYFNKSLKIEKAVFGKNHIELSYSLFNLGRTYKELGNLEKALKYYNRTLKIRKSYYGEEHKGISIIYSNIGIAYYDNSEYEKSLQYFQKSLISLIDDFNNENVYSLPKVKNREHKQILLLTLYNKVQVLFEQKSDISTLAALTHAYACDTLINQIRVFTNTKTDKLNLGEEAADLYTFASLICLTLAEKSDSPKEKEKYKNEALYFSEKTKSTVLLEALASAEAKKFAGISDSLLQLENELTSKIAYYEKELAQDTDSISKVKYRIRVFNLNRRKDSLSVFFENQYPEYYELKYNTEPVFVEDLQKLLDNNTSIISYNVSDSLITIFTMTKNNLDVKTIPNIKNLADTIKYYRYGLIFTSSPRFAEFYKDYAYKMYKQLIPVNIENEIKNLIIIPDAELSMIPFETLLTENPKNKDWKDLSYLVRKYTISYSYSANLFYKTFTKEPAKEIETTDLNDWLAFAPVFDDSITAGLTLRTRELLRQFDSEKDDLIGTRGRLVDGGYISPLPGTESEVQSIFKEFDKKGKKALVQIKKNANEEFIKQGGMRNYKLLHFATHGFVNTEKPELSGIFLAQDSTATEDGILYSGEIYNLKLNADLTVLSACETGLGEIKKGEGLIGLTRALLYAGSKNIIVSLWKVADNSTSELMIDFYKNLLEGEYEKQEFSQALQQSKLKMIDEGTYAHPFYWSPFILIGK